ncbi:hypothetical protein Moror_1190 [Moniliophthora roreri MCA 2997]|uniref:Uncharacterized protein n=2 Tax=Moniliophthora roreri TaxID=221103 RepID=V2X8A7_MONRO|nr:hypothetical protein Moror_1190 [Moniliophthora roreri MCA 2997]
MVGFLCYVCGSLFIWISTIAPLVLTFNIDIQPTVTVGQNATFSWTWNQTDPPFIRIALKTDASEGGCPNIQSISDLFKAFKQDDVVASLRLDEFPTEFDNTKRGSGDFTVRQTGLCRLCAYSSRRDSTRYARLTRVASSQEFYAVVSAVVASQDSRDQLSRTSIIAISAVGGFAFLLILVIVYSLYRQRKRPRGSLIGSMISPYLYFQAALRRPKGLWRRAGPEAIPTQHDAPSATRQLDPELRHDTPLNAGHSAASANDQIPMTTEVELDAGLDRGNITRSPPVNNQERERRIIYHHDSGWRPVARAAASRPEGGSVLEMPPRYDASV